MAIDQPQETVKGEYGTHQHSITNLFLLLLLKMAERFWRKDCLSSADQLEGEGTGHRLDGGEGKRGDRFPRQTGGSLWSVTVISLDVQVIFFLTNK